MGRYDQIPFRKVKARTEHKCTKCGDIVQAGEYYYTQRDKFLQTLHSPKFCSKCYQEHGAKFFTKQKKHTKDIESKKMDNYLEANK